MKANLARVKKLESSFLSCDKDLETILKKLFIENQPHSKELIRLLVVNTENYSSPAYDAVLEQYDLPTLIKEGYIRRNPRTKFGESEEVKSYITITFNNFKPNMFNPYYRDCTININVLSPLEYWDLEDYQERPLKIAGYVDGILNNSKLSGIGTLTLSSCKLDIFDSNIAGYSLMYNATHGIEDVLPIEEYVK